MNEPKDVVATLLKLPEVCFTKNRVTGGVIGIRRGVMGYYPIVTGATPETLNGPNVTKFQIEAMENGSMFGWEVPGADPEWLEALEKKRASA